MTALGAALGAGLAFGVLLLLSGLQHHDVVAKPLQRRHDLDALARRGLIAVVCAGVIGALTGWPVGAAGAGLAGWFGPRMLGSSRRARANETARIEAIAAWTELLRDGFAAGSLLESTIRATERTAPEAIGPEVARLCQRMRRARPRSTQLALRAFAADLADPTADMVVTALLLAANGAAANLAVLLSTLATSAREEVTMRLRIEAKRGEILLQRRVITGVIALFAGYLILFRRGYLHPFASPTGQVVLVVVIALFATSLWLMDRFSRFERVERTLRPEDV